MKSSSGGIRPPVALLGGLANSLSIVRSLGRHGIDVSVSCASGALAPYSRYCRNSYPVPVGECAQSYWAQLLLGSDQSPLDGHVIFACSDDALEFMANNREKLQQRYLLDDFMPELVRAMLDKRRTFELAREVGVAAPEFWVVDSVSCLDRLEDQVRFPVIAKPVHSHLFQKYYPGKKYLKPVSFAELRKQASEMLDKGLGVLICELIPGPDSLLSSYYTYLTPDHRALFHFTKKVIRRFPVNEGSGSYHATQWLPETAELGEKFFRGIGFRGLGNIEFKRDPRDGMLKVIESNVRFTHAHELLVQAGMDSAWIVYDHITGGSPKPKHDFKENKTLLFLEQDYRAYRQLRARGELTLLGWIRSIARRQVLPYFRLTDLRPFAVSFARRLGASWKEKWQRLIGA